MAKQELSILVVDDMKFSCAFIRQVLTTQGYQDIRVATSASKALEMMQERRAEVMLADWVMPEMDGLELAARVRQIDEEKNHYTCIILLTAKEGIEPLIEAFDRGVDDYLTKPPDKQELAARVYSAGRVASLQNGLLDAMQTLARDLEKNITVDPLTNIGNYRAMDLRLDELLLAAASRGGATCCAVIGVNGLDSLANQYGRKARDEVLISIANRLRRSVRPTDVVARLAADEFSLGQYYPEKTHFNAKNFKRILHALNLRPFKTSVGYLSVSSAIGVCCVEDTDSPSTSGQLMQCARVKVEESRASGYKEIGY